MTKKHDDKKHDDKIPAAPDLTPAEQSLLIMRATFLVQAHDSLGELAEACQELRRELAELPYTSTVERDKIQTNMNHKREQYYLAKNSLNTHKNNLARTLSDIQNRRLQAMPNPCDNGGEGKS